MWRDLAGFGEWQMAPYLAMALPFVAWRARPRLAAEAGLVPLVLSVMLAGFYAVYLLSPQDPRAALDTRRSSGCCSNSPLALLAWGLTFPWCEPVAPAEQRAKPRRVVFGMVNVLAAAGLVMALSGQLAANELAVKRTRAGTIRVTLGDGWFGREHREAATRGPEQRRRRSTCPDRRGAAGARSRCASPCAAWGLAKSSGWMAGAVAAGRPRRVAAVEIACLRAPARPHDAGITTDKPGVPSRRRPGARALAFAIHNVTVGGFRRDARRWRTQFH